MTTSGRASRRKPDVADTITSGLRLDARLGEIYPIQLASAAE